jgi:viroplasmin and RNaseH domain-containing protein
LHGAFETLEEAHTYMKRMGVTQVKEVIKVDAGETAPLNGNGFFAVANGINPGIYNLYR